MATIDILLKDTGIGLVIGTYGSVPCIHMQLESIRRFHPATPVLVADDCSPQGAELAALCEQYGADFHSNPRRMGHALGDMQHFITGHHWARERGMPWVVKLSRRLIPTAPWLDEVHQLISATPHFPTLSNTCSTHGFGFRSECVAMNVEAWAETNALKPLLDSIRENESQPETTPVQQSGILVEHLVHVSSAIAKRVMNPIPEESFREWPWMGTSRTIQQHGFLWHEACEPEYYARQAEQFGLSYAKFDFVPQA